jgi:GTP 3',8-cyclase
MEITPFNPHKLLFYRDKVEASLRGQLVYPVSVELDLSNVCNHKCPFCSFGTEESQGYRYQHWEMFPFPRILLLLEELKAVGVESITFTGGGEPLMHKQAAVIFDYATVLGFKWGLVTNGALLMGRNAGEVARGATFCRVSLDAGTNETHKFTHGVKHNQYDDILVNIGALRLRNAKLTIGASFCVMDQNLSEVFKAAGDLKKAGADYMEVRPTFPTEWRGDGWGMALTDVDRAKREVENARSYWNSETFKVIGMTQRFDNAYVERPEKNYSQCRVGPLTTVIGADGRLWHCCVQRGQPFFELGSVRERPFAEVWAEIHAKRDSSKIDVKQCPRCRYDGYNELIEHAFVSDAMHRSFV